MSLGQMAAYAPLVDVGPSDAASSSSRTCLFDLSVGLVEDVRASVPRGTDAAGYSPDFQLALPYRGFFVWHVGRDEVVGDANQALFVTGGEEYRLSHPLPGGYAELIITPSESIVSELAEANGVRRPHALFRRRSRRLSPRLQSFRARLLAWPKEPATAESIAAEELVLSLLRTPFDEHRPVEVPAPSTQRLMRRTKAFLEAELAKPLRLTDIGRAVGASPLYLTQVFRALEGVPLHQYLTQLRLARALAELPHADDLTQLALNVGFSSHSHFTARFRRAFGTTPSAFRRTSRA